MIGICLVLLWPLCVSACIRTKTPLMSCSDLSLTEVKSFVSQHNSYRSTIAKGNYVAMGMTRPAATNMRKISWSCSLAMSAQNWVDTCAFAHSGGAYGENLYSEFSSAPISLSGIAQRATKAWVDEYKTFGWPPGNIVTITSVPDTGHATQVTWALSNQIGCGAAKCPSTMPGFPYAVFVVCQYLEQGNVLGDPIYNPGPTCSKCGSGFTCEKSSGLCV